MRPRAPAVTAVIAAAGSGERLGASGPKAFVPLAGRPMIEWSIDAFRACDSVRSIVVAVPPGHVHDLAGHDLGVVSGGATRAQSVANAMAAVGTGLVAIHDAARPLVTPELVEALVACLDEAPEAAGVIAATPVTDTIKRVAPPSSSSRVVVETLDRAQLWAAQTPQVFRTEALRAALASSPNPEQATDEAMLVEEAGGTVLIHPTGTENFKVTTPLDLRVAELLVAERSASAGA
ncbi:MAG: 2-C-methyl-D-erythritol 4-phosphate cytidylyltransferase [Solirubrobacterales bacterium]